MKRIVLVVATLLIPLILFGQNSGLLKDAQDLFAAGNYSAAVTKFQEAVNKLSGRDRNIAQLQLATARTCVEALSNAKTAESAKDYDKAIAEYQKVLDANPNDTRVKGLQDAARRLKQEANPSLSVSKSSISFSSSGGTQKITVSCSMTWTLVDQTSSMCTVTRSGNEITITCTSNSSYSSRNTYFTVKTTNGVKEQRVSITQSGSTYSSSSSSSGRTSSTASYLNVSPTSITAERTEGTVIVDVKTDASDYSVSLLPSWCKVKSKYKTWFSLSYTANPNSSSRSDWFNVTAGGKTVKVTITQKANYSSYSGSSSSSGYGGYSGYSSSRSAYSSDKTFRIGLDASMDCFLGSNYNSYSYYDSYYYDSYDYDTPISFGIGLRARIGRYDQLFNLIGGVRYVFGSKHSGVLVPVLLNMNLLRSEDLGISMYLGGGYEFGFSNTYGGDAMLQLGMCGSHYDLSMYYKPSYQVLGLGFTYYF